MVLFAESVASLLYNKLSGRPWPSQFSIHVGRWSLLTLYSQMRRGHVLHSAIFNSLSIFLYIRRYQKCVSYVSSSTMSIVCSNWTRITLVHEVMLVHRWYQFIECMVFSHLDQHRISTSLFSCSAGQLL